MSTHASIFVKLNVTEPQPREIVFDKFVEFARSNGVTNWEQVGKPLLAAYGAWLDDAEYA